MEYTDNRLPESWVETRLGKVLDYGKTRKVEPAHMQPDNWVLELEDIEKDSSKLLGKWTVRDRQPKSSKNRFAKGDVLYGKLRPYLNKVIVADEDGICTTEIIPLSGNEHIHNRYLFYWLKSSRFVQYATQASYGMNMPRLGTQDGRNAPLILPPLPEQHYIADRLDSLMARADAAQARLQGLPTQLKHYRQAVLAAAVSGDLTADWREQTGCLKEWRTIKVGDIVEKIEAGKNLKCIETPPQEHQYGIVKISAVTWGVFDEMESKTLPNPQDFLENRRIMAGDFLISRANTLELVGSPVIVGAISKNLMLSDKVLRFCMADADKPWLAIFMRSSEGRAAIESRATGNQLSMRNIGQKALLDIDLPKPSPEEQTEIVHRAEKLLAHADAVEQAVAHSLQQLALLKQSLLARAFSGELSAAWRAQ